MWRIDDPQAAEVGKCKYDVVPYVRGRLMDIGAGPYRIFPYAITVDNLDHAGRFGWQYKPDVIADASNLSMFATGSFDSVFSSHTLEHLEDTAANLREWFRVIKPGGYLVLYLPHKDLYPNIGQPGANQDHKFDFHQDDITKIMEAVGCWDLVVNEVRDNDFGPGSTLNEYSFLQVFQKQAEGHSHSWKKPKPEKTAVVIRYGGFGDMIQSSSILKLLKEGGYHVTFNTTPAGQEILKADPHIDAFWLQDKDQVPMEELGNYWTAMKPRYDKFINLTESVEGTLLAVPGNTLHNWPKAARHAVCNQNYLEHTHRIAQLPDRYDQKFYPTDEEKAWARKTREDMGGNLIVCLSLSGSSVHKSWPHIDQLIARFLTTFPDVRIVLMGNQMCQLLERGWENEPRVLRRSGVWQIRESLTFVCREADLLIGPETGVLNAAGMELVQKICFLSHSTKENLTKHWKNTVSLTPPPSVDCYPCHMLHFNFDHCKKDAQTGVAACQAAIPVDMVWAASLGLLKKSGKLSLSGIMEAG